MSKQRFLVVSNSDQTRIRLAQVLAREGFNVDLAPTANTALLLADEKAYDVAVIDELLEKGRGPDLFQRIESRQTHVKGLLCSNDPTIDTVEAALDFGMQHVVPKPIEASQVVPLVRQMIACNPVGRLG